jgi:DNA polymerase-1
MKYLSSTNLWAIDIEADSLTPTTIWCVAVVNVEDRTNRHVFTDAQSFNNWLNETFPKLVGHNSLSFDIPNLNRLWGCGIDYTDVIDTLVMSYLWSPHLDGGHSLDVWGKRLGRPKLEFNDWSQLSDEMVRYCIVDTELAADVWAYLVREMQSVGFSELSIWIEHETRRIIDRQQAHGFWFNVAEAEALLSHLETLKAQLGQTISAEFPRRLVPKAVYDYKTKQDGTPYASYLRHVEKFPQIQFNRSGNKYRVFDWEDFNIGSPQQRVTRLLKLGWKPVHLTPKGNPKVDEEGLVSFAEQSGNAAVQAIADWLVVSSRASMVQSWLNEVNNGTNRIHGRVFSCGAGTRRMRHNAPNTANIPGVDARFGRECRSLWGVPDGRKLVGCDAAGLEGRVLVHYLGSSDAARYFLEADPHQCNADAIGYERRPTKNLFYAFMYGASDKKLGAMVGKGPGEGRRIRDILKRVIPGLDRLTAEIETEYHQRGGWLETIDGGHVRCPSPHAALNYKLQSAGGILMKRAQMYAEERLAHLDAAPVANIHDEWQYECAADVADEVGAILVQAIRDAGTDLGFNIAMDGTYNVGNNWAETH